MSHLEDLTFQQLTWSLIMMYLPYREIMFIVLDELRVLDAGVGQSLSSHNTIFHLFTRSRISQASRCPKFRTCQKLKS